MRQIRFPGESPEQRRARALRDRVDDLRDARSRIIAAADAERRRIERDLHDGAQQRMVSVALTLSLAEAKMRTDADAAAKLVRQAREEAQIAVTELRELARGIHPAVLSDRGLRPALEALAARAPVPVDVSGVPDESLPKEVEAAVYFVTAEALTNVAKYAQAGSATVTLRRDGGWVEVAFADDGTGLSGLADRVEALGGDLSVTSEPGAGTTVRARVPV